MIELGDHNIVLGRPFLSSMAARVKGDDCWIPTRHGPVALPQWVSSKCQEGRWRRKCRGGRLRKEGEVYLLIPQKGAGRVAL